MIREIIPYAAFIFEVLALTAVAGYAATRGPSWGRRAMEALWIALALETVHLLAGLADGLRSFPVWARDFQGAIFLFFMMAVYMFVQARLRFPGLGVFILPIVVLAGALSLRETRAAGSWPPASFWMGMHVPVTFLAYALFVNAFGLGLAYLLEERQIKSKKPSALLESLPSLEELDGTMDALIFTAFPALSVGLLFGVLAAHGSWGPSWGKDPKVFWSMATWCFYLAYLFVRNFFRWRGRRVTYFSMAGFAILIVTYLAANLFSPHHGF